MSKPINANEVEKIKEILGADVVMNKRQLQTKLLLMRNKIRQLEGDMEDPELKPLVWDEYKKLKHDYARLRVVFNCMI